MGIEVGVGEGGAGGGVDEGGVGGERGREEGEREGGEGEGESFGRETDVGAETVEGLGFVGETRLWIDARGCRSRRRTRSSVGLFHENERRMVQG